MIKLKDLLIEAKAKDGERYEQERTAAADALQHLVQSVKGFRSPNTGDEKAAANVMAAFVDQVHKLEKDWFRMTRKI